MDFTMFAIVVGILVMIILVQELLMAGARSGAAGMLPGTCPYPNRTDDTLSWIVAWILVLAIIVYLLYPA